jgi:hypothetical protein
MELNQVDYEKLKKLEESLWRSETRFDLEYMNKVLAPDFFEFGRSGRIYQREDTFGHPAEEIKAKLPLKNFTVRLIDTNVVQVTYISEVTYDGVVEVGNRSSIWSKTANGWQLRFHQGTSVSHD